MIDSLQSAKNRAIAQIEAIFEQSGWSDGWGLNDDEVRAAPSPLFYRNEAPVVAEESKVQIEGQSHRLYCIYNVSEVKPNYAGNRPSSYDITIALTFYFDDPFLFYETGNAQTQNPFKTFAEALLEELADDLWAISSDGEGSVPSGEDGKPYTNREILFVTNNF